MGTAPMGITHILHISAHITHISAHITHTFKFCTHYSHFTHTLLIFYSQYTHTLLTFYSHIHNTNVRGLCARPTPGVPVGLPSNHEDARRQAYIARHGSREDWGRTGVMTPGWLSRHLLWHGRSGASLRPSPHCRICTRVCAFAWPEFLQGLILITKLISELMGPNF